jgi:hypothetical protein
VAPRDLPQGGHCGGVAVDNGDGRVDELGALEAGRELFPGESPEGRKLLGEPGLVQLLKSERVHSD